MSTAILITMIIVIISNNSNNKHNVIMIITTTILIIFVPASQLQQRIGAHTNADADADADVEAEADAEAKAAADADADADSQLPPGKLQPVFIKSESELLSESLKSQSPTSTSRCPQELQSSGVRIRFFDYLQLTETCCGAPCIPSDKKQVSG